MRAALTRQRVFLAALGVLVVVLLFGSVQTTGALWADQTDGPADDLHTGTIGIRAGDGPSSPYTFHALTATNMEPSQSVSASLNIVNTGDTPLRYRLATAGPSGVGPAGTTVTMNLAGTIGTCPGAGSAFTAQNTSNPSTAFSTPGGWLALAKGGSTAWCVTAELVSVTPASNSASFTLTFHFEAEQTRP